MSYFPLFLKSGKQSVLLVGDTVAATAKLRLLMEAGVAVTMVGEKAGASIRRAGVSVDSVSEPRIKTINRPFHEADLMGKSLVYIASDDQSEIDRVVTWSRLKKVPLNIVDNPAESDFITPAMLERGPVRIAFSTGGNAPVFARRLRAALESALPKNLGYIAASAGRLRHKIKSIIPSDTARRGFWDSLFDRAHEAAFTESDTDVLDAHITNLAAKITSSNTGLIQLVGAGPGDPELLTLKAHRALQQADIVIYDKLVSGDVIALARRDAEFIYVGKSKGDHGIGQDGINALLIKGACEGKRVVRLKAGDPMVFGRAGEEIDAARAAGVKVDIIPGITALAGVSAATQIPLTHRDHAQALTLVTGQLKDGDIQDFAGLASKGRTLAIYMGLTTAADIESKLLAHGLPSDLPLAIVENGTRTGERRFYGTLAGLAQLVESNRIQSPGIIIIGEVVALAADLVLDDVLKLAV